MKFAAAPKLPSLTTPAAADVEAHIAREIAPLIARQVNHVELYVFARRVDHAEMTETHRNLQRDAVQALRTAGYSVTEYRSGGKIAVKLA